MKPWAYLQVEKIEELELHVSVRGLNKQLTEIVVTYLGRKGLIGPCEKTLNATLCRKLVKHLT